MEISVFETVLIVVGAFILLLTIVVLIFMNFILRKESHNLHNQLAHKEFAAVIFDKFDTRMADMENTIKEGRKHEENSSG